MNINFNYPVMIFRHDYNNNSYYKFGMSKKGNDGSYINGYMTCQFPKDVEMQNKTKIIVTEAWLSFYLKHTSSQNGEYNETIPYVFINKFDYENQDNDFTEEVSLEEIVPPTEEQSQIDIDDLDDYLEWSSVV